MSYIYYITPHTTSLGSHRRHSGTFSGKPIFVYLRRREMPPVITDGRTACAGVFTCKATFSISLKKFNYLFHTDFANIFLYTLYI